MSETLEEFLDKHGNKLQLGDTVKGVASDYCVWEGVVVRKDEDLVVHWISNNRNDYSKSEIYSGPLKGIMDSIEKK